MKTIELTQGKVALVDDDLFDELNRFRWCATKQGKTFYAVRAIKANGKKTTVRMHRDIFRLRGLPVPVEIDHRDRDGLNNQFENMRPATRQQQNRNQSKRSNNASGFAGVNLFQTRYWRAQAQDDSGKQKHIGYFDTALEAALARDAFVKQHHGDFAVLNFPEVYQAA